MWSSHSGMVSFGIGRESFVKPLLKLPGTLALATSSHPHWFTDYNTLRLLTRFQIPDEKLQYLS